MCVSELLYLVVLQKELFVVLTCSGYICVESAVVGYVDETAVIREVDGDNFGRIILDYSGRFESLNKLIVKLYFLR